MVGLGTLRTSFGAVAETSWEPCAHHLGPWQKPRPDFRAGYPQIGDRPGLGTSVVNGRG